MNLQFQIEAHNQNFMLREVEPELNPIGYNYYSSLLDVRIPLQGLLHSQKPSKTDSTPWFVLAPMDLNLQKFSSKVLQWL